MVSHHAFLRWIVRVFFDRTVPPFSFLLDRSCWTLPAGLGFHHESDIPPVTCGRDWRGRSLGEATAGKLPGRSAV